MFEKLMRSKSNLKNFEPLKEYLNMLEEFNPIKISEKYTNDCLQEIYQIGQEYLKVIILRDNLVDWVSFYRYRIPGVYTEQFEFINYKKNQTLDNREEYYNICLKYASSSEVEDAIRLSTATYYYFDNDLVFAWKEKRKLEKEELAKIPDNEYTNIAEKILNADKAGVDYLECVTLKGNEIKKLSLSYDE